VRILFLSPRQCWPAWSGAKLREYHLAQAWAEMGELTYVYFAEAGPAPSIKDGLPFAAEIVGVPKPKPYGMGKILQGALGPWPLPVLNYGSEEMSRALRRLLSSRAFDVLHVDHINMIRYAGMGGINGAKTIYDWHNIESSLMRDFSRRAPSPWRRRYAAATARKLENLEGKILEHAFGHFVCSERERDLLRRIAPTACVAVVENGVDCASFTETGDTPENKRDALLFVGLMDYFANVEAITSFARAAWPRLRERFPHLRLVVVGAQPAPAVWELEKLPGVEVTGTVPDIRPYYRDALAAIVPLRTGSGTRLKILEAMAARVPVIATPIGAEGLDATPGRDILMAEADDAAGWIGHIARLAESPQARRDITGAALDLVQRRYDWSIARRQLQQAYEIWTQDRN
jgi:glycosyltransferase involved in cell wall biosynthesis